MSAERYEKRRPPAFQMYAADRLADRAFRSMSAEERGLLHTMELECWTNGSVPAASRELARVLGLELAEVEASLTRWVLSYFTKAESTHGPVLLCPELERQRTEMAARRAKMSEGGKESVSKLNKRGKSGKSVSAEHPDSHPVGYPAKHPDSPADSRLRREELRRDEKSVSKEEHSEFLQEYDGPAPFEEDPAERFA